MLTPEKFIRELSRARQDRRTLDLLVDVKARQRKVGLPVQVGVPTQAVGARGVPEGMRPGQRPPPAQTRPSQQGAPVPVAQTSHQHSASSDSKEKKKEKKKKKFGMF
jgi:hypothetical protein